MSAEADEILNHLEQAKVQTRGLPPIRGLNSQGSPTAGPDYNANIPGVLPDVDALLADIQTRQANSNPNMSGAEDVGRSAITGLEQGVNGVVGLPATIRDTLGNMPHAADQAASWLLRKSGLMPEAQARPDFNPVSTLAQAGNPLALAAQFAKTPAQFDQRTEQLLGPFHQPQHLPARVAQRVGEFAPLALGGEGGVVPRALDVLGPAVASQGAQEVAPDKFKPVAALVGALMGGGAVGLARNVANAPSRTLAKALRDTPQTDIAKAAALQQTAADMGVHLTPPEALAQVTGGGNALNRLQHFVENSPSTASKVAPIFADRPSQIKGAVQAVADQIAPADTMPSATGLNAQDAAVQVLRNFDKMRSGATRPLYAAADAQVVAPSDINDIHLALGNAISADKTGKIASILGELKSDLAPNGEPLTDIGSLDIVRRIWRDKFDLPPNAPGTLLKTQAAKVAPFLEQLDSIMENASPSFRAGKALHADISRNIVNPVNNGPLGKIGASPDVGEQTAALYPNAPPEGAANETGMASALLPPDIASQLARHNVVNTFNTADRSLVGGDNQWAGARFARDIAGNDEQARALAAGLRRLPNGDAANSSVNNLVEVGRATGKRLPPGSGTAFNEERKAQLGLSPPSVRAFGSIADPLEWGRHIDRAVGGALYKRNLNALADMLKMGPNEAKVVLERARQAGADNTGLLPRLLTVQAAGDRK